MSLDNAEQVAYWSGSGGAAWAAAADRMDRELGPLGALAMDALALAAGSAVLDVGCGAGETTIELARRAGPTGRAVGVDVSGPLLQLARRRAAGGGLRNARFVQADAQHLAVDRKFDAAFSRFGVMFFADPVAAFAGLRRCLRPGGELGLVCWQSLAGNPWFGAVGTALSAVAGGAPQPPGPAGAPGPFAFAEPGRIGRLLTQAGWTGIQVRPEADELVLDEAAVQERIAFAVRQGPAAAALEALPAAVREQVPGRARDALAAFEREGAVVFRRAVWVATARA